MRLIDADKLISSIQKEIKDTKDIHAKVVLGLIISIIACQPTAYDIDKVVAELEEERQIAYADFTKYLLEYELLDFDEDDDWFFKGLIRAIDIVRKGGVE